MASRSPRVSKRRMSECDTDNNGEVDVSDIISRLPVTQAPSSHKSSLIEFPHTFNRYSAPGVLFDNRFSVQFHFRPTVDIHQVDRILIIPHGTFHLPRIVLRRPLLSSGDGTADDVLAELTVDAKPDKDGAYDFGWVSMRFIRVLDAI